MGSTSSDKTEVAPTKPPASGKSASSKMHRRSRSGCFTCRLRRKKCDEGKPKCKACRNLGLDCEYKRPLWWSNNETRRKQKDHIKSIIKRTKTNEKSTSASSTFQSHYRRISPPNLSHSVPTSDTYSDGNPSMGPRGPLAAHQTRASTPDSDSDDDDDYEQTFDPTFTNTPGFYDPYTMPMYTPQLSQQPLYSHGLPYEVDVKTERQLFINDVPTRRDSTISTFSTFDPPPHAAILPSYTGDDWAHHQPDYYSSTLKQEDWSTEEGLDFNFFDFSHGAPTHQPLQPTEQSQSSTIPMTDEDRPLFEYMLSNVLRLLFPILEANQHGSVRSDVILPALENNPAYLHSCLNAAAVHQRANLAPHSSSDLISQIDASILHHQYSFVAQVVDALSTDTSHNAILEATLGMISLSTVVGHSSSPCNPTDSPAEIPWHSHFQSAMELVNKLALPLALETMITSPHLHPPFNMTLTAWIDILGSTMLGRSPLYANTYRNKHIAGSTSGLAELMGCHDGVMYLLSEVACLDSLKCDRKLDDVAICSHITSLAQQLDHTEPQGEVLSSPYARSGALRPKQLSRNITAIFRKAARVYLCSLVPSYNRYDQAIVNLIVQMADILQYIPSGPAGFDRSLVWPYLICGANCIPTSPLRRVLAERIELLGEEADHGSFGRMVRLLQEVWRRNDEIAISAGVCEATPVTTGATSPGGSVTTPVIGVSAGNSHQSTPTKAGGASVHWRDVMRENGWNWLLI